MSEYIPYFIVGYSIVSLILLKNPTLLHNKKRAKFVRLIAHRGGAAEGYENTLPTYQRAVERGAEMIELDVQLSKDRTVVVAHDNDLSRLCDFNPGENYSQQTETAECRKFTLLESVLLQFPNTQINIDIKMENPDLVKAVNKIVCDNNAEDDCSISFGKLPRAILMICDFLLFRPSLIRHLASRGIPTYVWVLNEESEFRRALSAGAAGIMTDYPSKLKLFTMKI